MADHPDTLRAAAALVDEMAERLPASCRIPEIRARYEYGVELATELRQRAIQIELEGARDGQPKPA